jgi:hypothetical protein
VFKFSRIENRKLGGVIMFKEKDLVLLKYLFFIVNEDEVYCEMVKYSDDEKKSVIDFTVCENGSVI